jgi:antitoxin component of MazEF toxin-antitoxin module
MPSLISIGNSQGVAIPRAFIEPARLENKNIHQVVTEGLLISPMSKVSTTDTRNKRINF